MAAWSVVACLVVAWSVVACLAAAWSVVACLVVAWSVVACLVAACLVAAWSAALAKQLASQLLENKPRPSTILPDHLSPLPPVSLSKRDSPP